MMKYGLFSHVAWPEGASQRTVLEDKIEEIVVAEALGFESTWLGEHHFSRYGLMSCLPVFLSNVASRTKKIRLGTAVSTLPLHNPIMVAEQYAMLDVLSGGRVDLGVGRGFSPNERRVFAHKAEDAHAIYSEAVDVIVGLWTNPRFSYKGKFFQFEDVTIVPEPIQKPHPPVYMAVVANRASAEAAADKRLPVMVGIALDHEPAASWFGEYQKLAQARGFSVDTTYWPFQRFVYVAETEKEAREAPRDWIMWLWEAVPMVAALSTSDVHVDFQEWRRTHQPMFTWEKTLEDKAVIGTPETVAAKIKWLRDKYNIRHFIGDFSTGNMEQSMVLRNMELFAKKVMPLVG